MILKNEGFEILPTWKNSCDAVMIWWYMLKTDTQGDSRRWMDEGFWLSNLAFSSNRKLPWKNFDVAELDPCLQLGNTTCNSFQIVGMR